MSESFITIIPLGTTHFEAPLLSSEVVSVIQKEVKNRKKVLIFYSRRGNARAWICSDCGHYELCPHCDIALAYHTHPHKQLICHQCNHKTPFPIVCPNCHGNRIQAVGIGIQQIGENLEKILTKEVKILRIDSDTREKASILYEKIEGYDIVLATNIGNTITHPDIGAVIWLCFEVNLSIPSYSIEEEIHNEIAYYKKQQLPLYIQTYTPDHPLIGEIVHGNIRSFLGKTKKERKAFGYPPFSEFATIRVHSEQKNQVIDIMRKLVNKIALIKNESTFFAFDTDLWEKYAGEWQQKIILKDHHLEYIIKQLEVEIIRNRSVTLEWN